MKILLLRDLALKAGPYDLRDFRPAMIPAPDCSDDAVLAIDLSLPEPVVIDPPDVPPPDDIPTDPPVIDPPADPPEAPAPIGDYTAALAGLALPLKSTWSDTRPNYEALVFLTLADGTTLAVDTGTQDPDYVPYAGVWIYPLLRSDGTRHPDLTLVCYADQVCIANTWVDASANYTGHHVIRIDGETVEDVDSRYDFGCITAPCRKGLPQAAPSNAWDPKLTPNYGKIAGGYAPFTAALAKADNGINGRSLTTPSNGMGNTGSQNSIGVLHGATIPYVVDGGDANWTVVRTVEDHARCWPIHVRDRVTGLPASPSLPHCAGVTLLEAFIPHGKVGGGLTNPVQIKTHSPLLPDNAHCPGFGIVAALATGSIADIEEAIFWGTYESLWQNPSYRGFGKGISGGQVRGVAWQNRSKAYAAKLCPADHPLHDGLQAIVDANAAALAARYVDADAKYGNPYGILGGDGSFAYTLGGLTCLGMAPWQNDFNAAVVGQIVRMGFKGWDGVMAFLNLYTKARMGDGNTEALWWTTAAFYNGCPRIAASYPSMAAPREQYVADWTTFNNQNLTYAYAPDKTVGAVGPYAGQVGKTIDTADLGKGPGVPRAVSPVTDDFWANFQPALAALVDTGDGEAEWKRYADTVLAQKNYKYGGQFNIVPSVAP